jgi:hypothetical protein
MLVYLKGKFISIIDLNEVEPPRIPAFTAHHDLPELNI